MSLSFQHYQPTLLRDLYTCFRWTFNQDNVPLRLSYDDFSIRMLEKLGINGEISGVMLDEEELIGFILHSRNRFQGLDTVYNGGTGVMSVYRGMGIIQESRTPNRYIKRYVLMKNFIFKEFINIFC